MRARNYSLGTTLVMIWMYRWQSVHYPETGFAELGRISNEKSGYRP
jgi:hypothetical protein